jgi:hypothetical protein
MTNFHEDLNKYYGTAGYLKRVFIFKFRKISSDYTQDAPTCQAKATLATSDVGY